jgi:uncharacterized protein (TIGR02186 family)
MKARLLAALLVAAAPLPAGAEGLVSTLSDSTVEITSNFTGEQIVVFGAVRDAPPGDPGYGIAVVVEGPPQDLIVRQKGRVAGIWVNRDSREFDSVPSYYVMHLSGNFDAALKPPALAQYRLGLESLPFMQSAGDDARAKRFAHALIDLKTNGGLYAESPDEVTLLAPTVFRTTFFLPSDVPTGDYHVSAYLFRNDALLAGETNTLRIEKGGFSQEIARASMDYPFYYGLVCVALAVFTGWLAGIAFRR